MADVGDVVTKGQALATLSTATLALQKSQLLANAASVEAAIAQAEAQLADATAQMRPRPKRPPSGRPSFLPKGGCRLPPMIRLRPPPTSAASRVAVATQALASAHAQEKLMAAQMANVDLQLSRTSVVAPVSGVISARNAQLGAIASAAGQPLFVIMRDGALELRADVAGSDIARVAPDQTAVLTLSSGCGRGSGSRPSGRADH